MYQTMTNLYDWSTICYCLDCKFEYQLEQIEGSYKIGQVVDLTSIYVPFLIKRIFDFELSRKSINIIEICRVRYNKKALQIC